MEEASKNHREAVGLYLEDVIEAREEADFIPRPAPVEDRRLLAISSAEVQNILIRSGFTHSRTKGSHLQYVGIIVGRKKRVTAVANQELFPPGILKSMLIQSGLTEEDCLKEI